MKIQGILSFPHLFKANSNFGDEPKFSASLYIPKGDPQIAEILKAIEEAKAVTFPSGFPTGASVCLQDCSVKHPDQLNLSGYMVLATTAGQEYRPGIVDEDLQPITSSDEVYAGGIVVLDAKICGFTTGKKGVTCYLNNVLNLGVEGPLGRLTNRKTAQESFAGYVPNVASGASPRASAAPVIAPPPPGAVAPAPDFLEPDKTYDVGGTVYTRQQLLDSGWSEAHIKALG